MILKRSSGDASRTPALLRVALGTLAVVFVLGVTFLSGVFADRQGLVDRARTVVGRWDSSSYWNSLAAPALPELTIDMKFRHMEKVRAKREEALQRGILFASDDDFVPAQLRFEGRTIPVKMRLKGDWTDHLDTEKWSFRIKVKGDDQVMGMRRFSIQHPMTRQYVNEWGFLENLRMEGVLSPRYQFVNVILNGDDKGIYALEEFFAKELIESQGRREGVLLVFDESLFWERLGQLEEDYVRYDYAPGPLAPQGFSPHDFRNVLIKTYASRGVEKDPVLARQRDEAVGMLHGFQQGALHASQIFDVPILARYLAVSELWSASHSLGVLNSVFYYNPVTAKLEPVGFDAQPPFKQANELSGQLIALQRPWVRSALDDPVVSRAYVKEVERISSPDYLKEVRGGIGEPFEQYTRALHREWPSLPQPWANLRARQELLKKILEPPTIVQVIIVPDALNGHNASRLDTESSVTVQVANMFGLLTEVFGFKVGEGPVIPAADVVAMDGTAAIYVTDEGSVVLDAKAIEHPLEFVEFSVPIPAASTISSAGGVSPIVVLSRLMGESRIRETPATPYFTISADTAVPTAPTVEQALELHPYLEPTDDASMLWIPPGEWDIDKDLVLPDGIGLYVGPGTTLRFAPSAILLARGLLLFQGTAEEPVVLGPSGSSWAGVVVLGAEKSSLWQHVAVRNTHGIERGGWTLTGGITFYESPVTLSRTRLEGSSAEDAINIIRTSFIFDNIEIAGAESDAFDGDFTQGSITNSSFHDIVGDAIDVSGSTITVEDIVVRNVGDKGISAGESSHVEVTRFQGENVGIGVASKDRSSVSISDSTLRGFVNAGLAAFTKKREYGPASVIAENVTLEGGNNPVLIQEGSWIERDGEYLGGTELDVQALYSAGVLGN